MQAQQILLDLLMNNEGYTIEELKELAVEPDDNELLRLLFSILGNAFGQIDNSSQVEDLNYITSCCDYIIKIIQTSDHLDGEEVHNGIKYCERRFKKCHERLDKSIKALHNLLDNIKHNKLSQMVIHNVRNLKVSKKEENYTFLHCLIFEDKDYSTIKELLRQCPGLVNIKNKNRSLLDEAINYYRKLIKKPIDEYDYIYFEKIIKLIYYNAKFVYSDRMREIHLKKIDQMIADLIGDQRQYVTARLERIKQILSDTKYELQEQFEEELIGDYNLSRVLDIRKEIAYIKQKSIVDELNRRDFTKLPIFMIDGPDAQVLDDGLSLVVLDDGYIVGIHIVDVSHYIKEGTRLDCEAFARTTSIYLKDRVIHMFPLEVSMDLCSLKPNTKRNAISCFVRFDKEGNRLDYSIEQTIIQSSQRVRCDQVGHLLTKGSEDKYLQEILSHLYALSDARKDKFNIALPSCEEIGIGTIGSKIVAPFMISYNQIMAEEFSKRGLPFIYRGMPDIEHSKTSKKIESLDQLKKDASLTDDAYNAILNAIINSEYRGKYSTENIGHAGLGVSAYAHCTSPLRRYPDVIDQRLAHTFLFRALSASEQQALIKIWNQKLASIVPHINEKQRQARLYYKDRDQDDCVKEKKVVLTKTMQ